MVWGQILQFIGQVSLRQLAKIIQERDEIRVNCMITIVSLGPGPISDLPFRERVSNFKDKIIKDKS